MPLFHQIHVAQTDQGDLTYLKELLKIQVEKKKKKLFLHNMAGAMRAHDDVTSGKKKVLT